jgi:phenylpropionate dioxygenase-like ring-hydroxylating dioxygenase large terminal subunit
MAQVRTDGIDMSDVLNVTTEALPDDAPIFDVEGEERIYNAMRHFWQPVMYASELGDQPKAVKLCGESLVVVRLEGEPRCFNDICAHRGAALSLGWVDDDCIRCPYHGWTYNANGDCTAIPARFGTVIPSRAKLASHKVVEKSGLIWVCLDGEPSLPVPDFPYLDQPRFRVIEVPEYTWKTSTHRRIENYVDISHFAWIHDGVLGDHNHPEVVDFDVNRDDTSLQFSYIDHVETGSIGKNEGLVDDTEDSFSAELSYRLFLPGTVLLEQQLPNDHTYALFFSVCPVGPKETRNFTFMARDYNLDNPDDGDRTMLEYNDLVISQDMPVVESQRPEELPFDISAELHIRGVDKVSLEYRKWLVRLTVGLGL